MFQKAVRHMAKARIGLSGPSGSGKTYSALVLARELGKRIAVIDTENKSAALYANEFDFDTACLTAPYTPDKYVKAIHEAEKAGYDVIVVDSLTHAWAGVGGALDMVNAVASAQKNQYTAWRAVTPEHNKLVDALIQSPAHIIASIRAKHEYEQYEEGGKKGVRRIGMAPVMREGIEYEFTMFGELTIPDNLAIFSKDRTRLFRGRVPFLIQPEDGKAILDWLNSGAPEVREACATPQPEPRPAPTPLPQSQSQENGPDLSTNSGPSEPPVAAPSQAKTINWGKLAVARKETSKIIAREITDEDLTAFGAKAFKKNSKTEWTVDEYEFCLKWLRRMYEAKKYDGFLDA